MLTEHIQYFLYRATLLGTCVELSVGIGTCPTLSKAIVAFVVDPLRLGDGSQVQLTLMNVLAAFQHHRPQTEFYQTKGGKESTGACTHDNDLRFPAHIGIIGVLVLIGHRFLVHVHTHFQVHIDGSLPCVYAPFQDTHSRYRTHIYALFLSQPRLQRLLVGCNLGQHPDLIFTRHRIYIIYI